MPVSQKNTPTSSSSPVKSGKNSGTRNSLKSSVSPQNSKNKSVQNSTVEGTSGSTTVQEILAKELPNKYTARPDRLGQDSPAGGTPIESDAPTPVGTIASHPCVNANYNISMDSEMASNLISSRQRRLDYFRNGTATDCEVHVPKTANDGANVCYKKFRCHRIFLASASEKLEQDIIENKLWNGVLQMNGVSPESVEIFLEYIYTFEVTLSKVNLHLIGDIYILSSAYNMPDLLSKFSQQLKNTEWPLEGILPAYNLAFRHNILDLEYVCMEKIMENAAELKTLPSIMELQIYALNYLIQHWLVIEALSANEIIQILQQYQRQNSLNFSNTQQFPHFTKLMKYFPNVLLDAEGLIIKY